MTNSTMKEKDIRRTVTAIYFSATGTTRKIVSCVAERLSGHLNSSGGIQVVDFTPSAIRERPASFTKTDVVVFGVPVYAGRVPNVLVDYIGSVRGNGATAIAVVVFGNRDYDDALIELKDLLESGGFTVIAGGSFIGEHSFSVTLAKDRPDESDIQIAGVFADQVARKIGNRNFSSVAVKGRQPYRKHYVPKNPAGAPVDIRKVKPKTNDRCTDCKHCVAVCPMASIDAEDVSIIKGICIKCGACIKKCSNQAKYFDDEDFLRHKQEIELEFSSRKEPELFL